VICDNCGQDRIREHARVLAYFRKGWLPLEFHVVCPGCRAELGWESTLRRGLFLLCCLALLAALAACGYGIVALIQWLSRQS